MSAIGIGLLGCGVVGSAVVRGLGHVPLAADMRLEGVAVRRPEMARDCPLPPGVLTTDPWAVVEDPRVDVVVEVMGGLEGATLTAQALELGKPVVTANDLVLGAEGPGLQAVADDRGGLLLVEAAVAGAVPVVRGLSGLRRADEIVKVQGLLNGTTTLVLSHMAATGCTLPEALEEARRRGCADADATRAVDGRDAADKLAVLVQYLFGEPLRGDDVARLGIDILDHDDIVGSGDRRWRLLATAVKGACARVEPVALPAAHPFAQLEGTASAVTVTGRRCGAVTVVGGGTGGEVAACSAIADLMEARDWLHRRHRDWPLRGLSSEDLPATVRRGRRHEEGRHEPRRSPPRVVPLAGQARP